MKVTNEQIEQWRQFVAEYGGFGGQLACAKEYGVSVKTVQKHTGDIMQALLKARNEKIIEFRRNLMTQAEIADALEISEDVVRIICKKAGMGGQIRSNWATLTAMEAQKRGREKAHSRIKAEQEAKYREQVEVAGLEYLGGYTNCDGFIDVHYPQCGHIGKISCQVLRKTGKIQPCAICASEQRQRVADEKERQKAEAKEAARIEREAKEMAAQEKKAARVNVCLTCGAEFHPEHGGQHYCSDDCRRKAGNRRREARKRGQRRTIQLEQVFQKEKGRCYLCGGSCDFEDYQIIDGAFVVGSNYPTVEHVIPMCLGGDDSWENVRLACHRCNSIKGRKSDVRVEKSGQIAFML